MEEDVGGRGDRGRNIHQPATAGVGETSRCELESEADKPPNIKLHSSYHRRKAVWHYGTMTQLAGNSIDGYISEQSRICSTNVDMFLWQRYIFVTDHIITACVGSAGAGESWGNVNTKTALDCAAESSICCLVNYAKSVCFGSQARHLICNYCFPEHNKYILNCQISTSVVWK